MQNRFIFKAMEREIAEKILREGSFWFRPLSYYKSLESNTVFDSTNAFYDPKEGEVNYAGGLVELRMRESITGKFKPIAQLNHSKITVKEHDQYRYVLCFTQSKSREIQEAFKHTGLQYDCYLVVSQPHLFVYLNEWCLKYDVKLEASPVEYGITESNRSDASQFPWIFKDERFRYQQEYRFGFFYEKCLSKIEVNLGQLPEGVAWIEHYV